MKTIYHKNAGSGFSNPKFNKFASIAFSALLAVMIILGIFEPSSSAAKPQVLPVEVLEQPTPEQQNAGAYDPEKLQQSRRLTPTQIVGLVVMWIVIIIFVITIGIYLRQQKILIKRSYYNAGHN